MKYLFLKKITFIVNLFFFIFLVGCVNHTNIRVKTFSDVDINELKGTYNFAYQDSSDLENKHYVNELKKYLENFGFIYKEKNPKYSVTPTFGVNVKDYLESRPNYVNDYYLAPFVYYDKESKKEYISYQWLSAGMRYAGNTTYNYSIFYHFLNLDIHQNGKKVYQARVVMPLESNQMMKMYSYLIKALFIKFPMNNATEIQYRFNFKDNTITEKK